MHDTLTHHHDTVQHDQERALRLVEQVATAMAKLDCSTARQNTDGSYTLTRGHDYLELVIAPDAQTGEPGVAITEGAEEDLIGNRTVWLWQGEIERDLHDACMGAFDRLNTKATLRKAKIL